MNPPGQRTNAELSNLTRLERFAVLQAACSSEGWDGHVYELAMLIGMPGSAFDALPIGPPKRIHISRPARLLSDLRRGLATHQTHGRRRKAWWSRKKMLQAIELMELVVAEHALLSGSDPNDRDRMKLSMA